LTLHRAFSDRASERLENILLSKIQTALFDFRRSVHS